MGRIERQWMEQKEETSTVADALLVGILCKFGA